MQSAGDKTRALNKAAQQHLGRTQVTKLPLRCTSEAQCCTNLVGCMLSCCCHWCHCHYCSSWCCSPCDWHMHSANCRAATAGLEVHPCWEGRVCNKEDHRLSIKSCHHRWWMSMGRWHVHHLEKGDISPQCFHNVTAFLLWVFVWHKGTQISLTCQHCIQILLFDTPLLRDKEEAKTLNLDELSKRGKCQRQIKWSNERQAEIISRNSFVKSLHSL